MTTSLFVAAITAAARQARADKISVTAAKKALATAYAETKPLKLPAGVTMDEFGGMFYRDVPGVAAFSPDNILYATTPQQIANIRVQVGMNDAGEFVAAGPSFQGWSEGQTVNSFNVPLQRLASITAAGTPKYAVADGPGTSHGSYLYPRLRLRISGQETVLAELQKFAQQRRGG